MDVGELVKRYGLPVAIGAAAGLVILVLIALGRGGGQTAAPGAAAPYVPAPVEAAPPALVAGHNCTGQVSWASGINFTWAFQGDGTFNAFETAKTSNKWSGTWSQNGDQVTFSSPGDGDIKYVGAYSGANLIGGATETSGASKGTFQLSCN